MWLSKRRAKERAINNHSNYRKILNVESWSGWRVYMLMRGRWCSSQAATAIEQIRTIRKISNILLTVWNSNIESYSGSQAKTYMWVAAITLNRLSNTLLEVECWCSVHSEQNTEFLNEKFELGCSVATCTLRKHLWNADFGSAFWVNILEQAVHRWR